MIIRLSSFTSIFPQSSIPEETPEESEGSQALKDDLLLLEKIDTLRMQLKGSYTVMMFYKRSCRLKSIFEALLNRPTRYLLI